MNEWEWMKRKQTNRRLEKIARCKWSTRFIFIFIYDFVSTVNKWRVQHNVPQQRNAREQVNATIVRNAAYCTATTDYSCLITRGTRSGLLFRFLWMKAIILCDALWSLVRRRITARYVCRHSSQMEMHKMKSWLCFCLAPLWHWPAAVFTIHSTCIFDQTSFGGINSMKMNYILKTFKCNSNYTQINASINYTNGLEDNNWVRMFWEAIEWLTLKIVYDMLKRTSVKLLLTKNSHLLTSNCISSYCSSICFPPFAAKQKKNIWTLVNGMTEMKQIEK